ncbi:MAG: DNA polymerase III subunit delta [Bacilli bacterium]|nr:DNA polymerase III subunit delta [Bacilli bacterium]MDY6363228.1 DNA polymerase III subunit delta [Bacilli bacterium]
MNYILYGEQFPMIKKRLSKILKERLGEPDSFNVVKFDLDETDPNEIVGEAELLPLGYDRKAVIVDHCSFLANGGNKELREIFTKLIQNSSDEIDLILIHRSATIDDKLPLVQEVKEKGQIFNFVNLKKDDWPVFIKKYFKDHNVEIEPAAVNELASRVDGDLYRFMNEAQKLTLYKDKITVADVALMVSKPIEDDVFQISNALMRGDNATALSIYRDLRKIDYRATETLIPMLGTQFRFISQVCFLDEKGLEKGQIAKQLGTSEVRVSIALKNSRYLSRTMIANALDDLYQLDYNIKSGQIDRYYGFELFLINFPN